MAARRSSTKGFKRTSSLLESRIRKTSEQRGFGQSRLLTRWDEIVGPDIAEIARPVEVSYARKGFGATLTVLSSGPNAPVIEMQKETLRKRINSVYGYNAIARIRITQTAPSGFEMTTKNQQQSERPATVSVEAQTRARDLATPVGDSELRKALEALGANVLSRSTN